MYNLVIWSDWSMASRKVLPLPFRKSTVALSGSRLGIPNQGWSTRPDLGQIWLPGIWSGCERALSDSTWPWSGRVFHHRSRPCLAIYARAWNYFETNISSLWISESSYLSRSSFTKVIATNIIYFYY